jgi:hypothetical protein
VQAQGWGQGMRGWRPPMDGAMNGEKRARPLPVPGMRQFVSVESEEDSEGLEMKKERQRLHGQAFQDHPRMLEQKSYYCRWKKVLLFRRQIRH